MLPCTPPVLLLYTRCTYLVMWEIRKVFYVPAIHVPTRLRPYIFQISVYAPGGFGLRRFESESGRTVPRLALNVNHGIVLNVNATWHCDARP